MSSRCRTPTAPRVEALLRQATARLTAMAPSIPARITAGTLDPDLPGGLVIEAVLRVYRNPTGVTQQTAGPYSRILSKDAASNVISFDPAEVAAVLAPAAEHGAGVGTFRVRQHRPHVPVTALDGVPPYPYIPEQFRPIW